MFQVQKVLILQVVFLIDVAVRVNEEELLFDGLLLAGEEIPPPADSPPNDLVLQAPQDMAQDVVGLRRLPNRDVFASPIVVVASNSVAREAHEFVLLLSSCFGLLRPAGLWLADFAAPMFVAQQQPHSSFYDKRIPNNPQSRSKSPKSQLPSRYDP